MGDQDRLRNLKERRPGSVEAVFTEDAFQIPGVSDTTPGMMKSRSNA